MGRFLRVLKASLIIGLAWGTAWALAGVGIAIWDGGGFPFGSLGEFIAFVSGLLGTVGFVGGAGFALALAAAERNRTLDDLSRIRVGLLGALGGMASLPVSGFVIGLLSDSTSVVLDPTALGVMALFGAGSSLGTLAIARSSPALPAAEPDGKVLESGEE